MDAVIRVQNASVRFNLAKEKTDNIKEYFVKLLKRQLMFEEFYAVRDIDFTVQRGEAWALVGHNGCGKSTLLKLISGIIQPYTGSVEVNGMIAPIIELSAGMDPDMTARENIFLNGAFLGYTEQLLNEKYDEIVEFAEIEEFIDVPVKNFSSGMLARLGFSIATVVRPDILIIDEVLSVGDMHFQKKSLQRIQELLAQETTLLFVSHALPTVREICDKALWLDHGQIVAAGDVDAICDAYAETEK